MFAQRPRKTKADVWSFGFGPSCRSGKARKGSPRRPGRPGPSSLCIGFVGERSHRIARRSSSGPACPRPRWTVRARGPGSVPAAFAWKIQTWPQPCYLAGTLSASPASLSGRCRVPTTAANAPFAVRTLEPAPLMAQTHKAFTKDEQLNSLFCCNTLRVLSAINIFRRFHCCKLTLQQMTAFIRSLLGPCFVHLRAPPRS